MGVVAFSRSSIFFADGVLALLLVPLLGDGGGTSFLTCPLNGTEEGPSLSRPFSLGEVVPFAAGLVGPSLASSTTKSWSLFSPSLCCLAERNVHGFNERDQSISSYDVSFNARATYMSYILVLLLLHLLQVQVLVMLRIRRAARPAVLFAFRRRYRASLKR